MKIKMFISSYFPLYIIIVLLSYEHFNSKENLLKLVKYEDLGVSIFITVLLILIVVSLWTVWDLKKTKANENVSLSNIEKMEEAMMVYFMTYVVPLLADDFLEVDTLITNISLFLLIGFMYVRSNLIYLNPLWLIFGYSVYKANGNFIIISNMGYDELAARNGRNFRVTLVASKIYIVQKKDQV